jgi:aspartyl-tRNA(Asn)/glutamyl-tRNA(Gln) amidotransferase subunit A
MELCDRTGHELSALLAKGDTSCSEILDSVLDRISAVETTVGSYITLDPDGAMRRARALDSARHGGRRQGPLWGIPVAVKDNVCTKRIRTSCASKILESYVPPYDATVVERLTRAGAIIVGKTNMDEFGMGSSTEHSAFKVTKNPWNPHRVPGGSSGGSAAAVAAGESVLALGSDTGGSVRLPSSFCGLVGLRPTYGTVSRYGLVAFGSSMDQIGPIARDVSDCAALLEVLAGPDGRDSAAMSDPAGPFWPLGDPASLNGKRVGVPRRILETGLSDEVEALFEEALEVLKGLGAEIVDIEIMDPSYAVAAYYIIANAEASSNLARYDGVRYGLRCGGRDLDDMYRGTREAGFGTEVKRRILLGTYVLSSGYYDEYYLKASRVRNLVARDLSAALASVDLIALPSAAAEAFMLGEKLDDPIVMYMTDVFTVAPCLARMPAISLPMGLTGKGLPAGLQLVGPPRGELRLLQVGHSYQDATAHHTIRPSIECLGNGKASTGGAAGGSGERV